MIEETHVKKRNKKKKWVQQVTEWMSFEWISEWMNKWMNK